MNLKPCLVASIGLNVVLVALLLRTSGSPGQPSPAPNVAELNRAGGDEVERTLEPGDVPVLVAGAPGRQFSWEDVESPDYREYITNLRAIGCPEETIRDIILADVNKLYEEKKRQVRGGPRRFEFWKAGNPMAAMMGDPEVLRQMRALEEEKHGVLRALGIEPDAMSQLLASAGGNPMELMFDFLSEEKRAAVVKTMTDFQSKMIESAQDGVNDPAQMMSMQFELERALEGLLSPEEFLDYQLRFSTTANMMRQQLAGFDPDETEFLAVFRLREAFDREYPPMRQMDETDEQRDRRVEAQLALNAQIRQTLSDDRYAAYERAQDFHFQQLHRVAQRTGLGTEGAIQAHDIKQIAERQAMAVRQDAALNQTARESALHGIRQETESALRQTLGEEGWEQYNRRQTIWWLDNISHF